ncbi:putative ribonuclease H-like domain-containing protein [Tanacetum coccineum]
MRPFGCPVTILNTLDPLGKFDEKADEGFFVGYSINSKAFRVFNTRTRKVEENLHVNFLENKPNVAGSRQDWLFDIDLLTNFINYEPVTAGNQTNDDACIKTNDNAGQARQEKAADHEYILLPFLTSDSSISGTDDQERTDSSTQDINNVSTNINTSSLNINTVSTNDLNMPSLEETDIFDGAYYDEDVGAEADLNNLETTMNASPIPITRIHKDHPKDQIIGDLNLSTQTRRMINFSKENAMMDVKSAFLYGTIKEEVYVCQPPSFEDPQFPNKVYKVYVDDIIFGSTKKALCVEFEQMMHKRFQMSSMGELTFFLRLQVQQKEDGIFIIQDKYVADILKKFDFTTVKAASTLIETNKGLNKDEEAEDVDVHLYRSMIGSLMYLTASRPDIMFAVCACARFQVTLKTSHLYAVKMIFRYLKGLPKLGLWYPRDSPFDLEAFSDSDYVRASLDRKSTTGGCQFLGKRLISYQCKKQTIVANSTIEAEYVDAANCCGQNLVLHSKTKHIEIRHHFIRDSYEKKLIQVIKIHTDHNAADLLTKAFDTQKPWKAKRTTKISQSSRPIHLVADETVYKEWEDKMERAVTTASSLEVEFEAASKQSNDPPISRVNTLGSREDSMKLKELMGEGSTVPVESHQTPSRAPTTSQPLLSSPSRIPTRQETEVPQPSSPTYTNVADEAAFTSVDVVHEGDATTVSSINAGQGSGNIPNPLSCPMIHLSQEVKKLEQTVKTSQSRRRIKIVVLDDEESSEDTSKQGRMIEEIDQDAGISLVTPTKISSQEYQSKDQLGVLSAAKVLADAAKKNVNTYTRRKKAVSTASMIFSTAKEYVSTAGASMPVSTAGMVQQVNIIIPSSSETTETTKDKGKAIMQESEQPKKIKKRVQIQMSLDEELAQKLHEEEQARFNAEQEAKFNAEQEELLASETTEDEANPPVADIDWDDVQAQIQADEDLAQKLLEEERENLSIEERARLLAELIDKRKKLQAAQRYEAIRNKPQTMSQQRKTMCTYMKNMAGYKMEHFKGKSFYEVKEMFDNVYKQVTSFVPMDSVMEKERTKRAGLNLQEESSKRQKTREGSEPTEELKADEISQEDLQQMIMVVPVEEVYVEALQVKYPIIDWEVYSEDTRKYWKIIRVGNHTEAYQTFDDMLKKFDRDDLDKLWSLVKERFSSTDPTVIDSS